MSAEIPVADDATLSLRQIGVNLRRYLEANTVFYGSVAASIIYFWNWFLTLSPGNVADGQFWSVLGAALPILMVVAGLRVWGMTRRSVAA